MKTVLIKLLILSFIFQCSKQNIERNIDSDNYKNKEERIAVLNKEMNAKSQILDAEFELFNSNGFKNDTSLLVGPTDVNYQIAVKIDTFNIRKWTDTYRKVDILNNALLWTEKIINNRKDFWKTSSKPEYYIGEKENSILIVHRIEGIIFKQIILN